MTHAPKPVAIPPRPNAGRPAFDFSHATVLITGGGSGIGHTIAHLFATLGAKVAITGRRHDKLAESKAKIAAATKAEVVTLTGDVRDEATIKQWHDTLKATWGKVSTLVNNAGVIGNGTTQETTVAEWDRIMDTNVKSVFLVTKALAPLVIAAGPDQGASIVNLSSVTALRPYANLLAYCASKAAVDMMTQCMAMEFAPLGVRVNAVAPGVVRSELHVSGKSVTDYPAFLERANSTHPLGRHGEPEDVAWAVAYLASKEAAWVTGQQLAVDGGRSRTSLR